MKCKYSFLFVSSFLSLFKLWGLTEVVPGSQDDNDSVLAFQGLPHVLFIENVSYLHPGGFVVSRQPGRVPHQHRHIVSWGNTVVKQISGAAAETNTPTISPMIFFNKSNSFPKNCFYCICNDDAALCGFRTHVNVVVILSTFIGSFFRISWHFPSGQGKWRVKRETDECQLCIDKWPYCSCQWRLIGCSAVTVACVVGLNMHRNPTGWHYLKLIKLE